MSDIFNETSADGGDATLRYEDLLALVKRYAPAAPRNPLMASYMPVFEMPVFEMPDQPLEIVGYRTVRSPGHPFVKWLARFIPFEPDVVFERPIYGRPQIAYKTEFGLFLQRTDARALYAVSA